MRFVVTLLIMSLALLAVSAHAQEPDTRLVVPGSASEGGRCG